MLRKFAYNRILQCIDLYRCDHVIHYVPYAQLRFWPLSRRLGRCDRVIQSEANDPFSGNVYYVTMQITLFTRKFRNGLTLDCNGVFAIKAYRRGLRQRVASITLACNGVFTIKTYGTIQNSSTTMTYQVKSAFSDLYFKESKHSFMSIALYR